MLEQLGDRWDRCLVTHQEERGCVGIDVIAPAWPGYRDILAWLRCHCPCRRDARIVDNHIELKFQPARIESSWCECADDGPRAILEEELVAVPMRHLQRSGSGQQQSNARRRMLDRESGEIVPAKDHTRHSWRNGFSSPDGEPSKRWGLTTESHFGHRPTLMAQRLWERTPAVWARLSLLSGW